MPSGSRIRSNSVFGTVADNPLSSIATTFNSNQLLLLPTVTTQHAVITLDPLRQFGDPEIIIVTTHTAAATVATITRAAYGTSAREHPFGTVWVHALIDEDTIEILTSGTRPGDPYAGQAIYETDTNRLVMRDASNTIWNRTAWTASTGRTGVSLRSTGQSIPDAVETAIAWDTSDFDSDGFATVPDSNITVPAGLGGLYSITAVGSVPVDPSVRSYCYLSAPGGAYLMGNQASVDRFVYSTTVVPCVAGQNIVFFVYQDHTGAQNFTGQFHMYRIGA